MLTVYFDDRRALTISDDGHVLTAVAKAGRASVALDSAKVSGITPSLAARVRKTGQDLTGWFVVTAGVQTLVLNPEARPAVETAIANRQAAKIAETDAKAREQAERAATMEGRREALVRAEHDTYSPEHFPGSTAWRKNKAAADALAVFDIAHLEIAATAAEKRAADERARYEALSDFVKAGG